MALNGRVHSVFRGFVAGLSWFRFEIFDFPYLGSCDFSWSLVQSCQSTLAFLWLFVAH